MMVGIVEEKGCVCSCIITNILQKILSNKFKVGDSEISPACVLMKSTAKSLYMSSIVSILAGCWTIVKFWKIGQPGE